MAFQCFEVLTFRGRECPRAASKTFTMASIFSSTEVALEIFKSGISAKSLSLGKDFLFFEMFNQRIEPSIS